MLAGVMTGHPNNLPLQLTSLVGRAREIEALRGLLLGDGARMVTLTGPGGSGKTRLALEVASTLLPAFADGVFLVSLAPLRDAGLVASDIAQTLEVRRAAACARRQPQGVPTRARATPRARQL